MKRLTIVRCLIGLAAIASSAIASPAFLPHLTVLPHYQAFDGGTVYYQGQATQTDGSPVADGPHAFIFSLHDHETASSVVWTEPQTVSTTNGLFSVKLGEVNPIVLDDLATLGQDTARVLYLEISIDGETISPRTRLGAVPFAHASQRVLGDVETDLGGLLIRYPGSLDSALLLHAETSGGQSASFNLSGGGTVGAQLKVDNSSGHLTISNIGSSGEDGVSIDVEEDLSGIMTFHLNPAGETTSVSFGWSTPDGSSGSIRAIDPTTGNEVRIASQASSSGGGTLTVSNIGSSGEDGVSLNAGIGTVEVKLGIEHEDIGVRMYASDDGSGAGLIVIDTGLNDSGLIELRTSVAGGGHLTISNIGSSGKDGVSIDVEGGTAALSIVSSGIDGVSIQAGPGGDRKIALKDMSSGQTIETEIVALSLVSTEPIMVIREQDAAPLDLPIFRLEYDANGRVVQRMSSTPAAPGDSSELHSSGLHLYNGFDRVRIEVDNGSKLSLRRLQSAQTIETEIIAMSLSGSEPLLSLRMPDAIPTDPPLTEYSYDLLNRRIIETRRSETGQPGDSSTQSSTELIFNDFSAGIEFGINGLQFTDASGPTFSVSPGGVIQNRASCALATDFGTSVGIGGTNPGVKLFVDGDICATGLIGPCSDMRYKQNIETIANPIEKILKLRGVSFDWKRDEFSDLKFTDRHQLGLIAQEVKDVVPEVVSQADNGYYFVDYSRLTPLLIEALKAQQETIEELKTEVAQAGKVIGQIDDMKVQIAQLQSMVEILIADKTVPGKAKLAVR